jgi:hypothetical protein
VLAIYLNLSPNPSFNMTVWIAFYVSAGREWPNGSELFAVLVK